MGSKSSSQQNTSSGTFADPQAAADYTYAIKRAKDASKTPYQAYTGELTAGVNAQENLATGAMNGLAATANGYYGQAAQQSGLGAAAVNPTAVDGAAISQYESPYQQDVINATMAQIQQQNKIQQNQQTSNAIGAGAFGGDRAGLAGAALAGQQALATNSTLAGLNNQNYAQALGEANTQQQVGLGAAQANRAALQQNAETLAGIGSAATNSGLGVANAQLGAGALQQQTQQAGDTAQYGQFEQKQAYPFQTAQYLASIVGALAPNYGSSTYGQTTTQTSPLNSILGLGLGAAALAPGVGSIGSGLSSLGSGLSGLFRASGGSVAPYADVDGYVPSVGLSAAHMLTAPPAQSPSQPTDPIPNFNQFTQAGQGLSALASGAGTMAGGLGQAANFLSTPNVIGFRANGGKVVGLAPARRGYDGGGVVGNDGLMFDPNALGAIGQFAPGVGAVPPPQTMTPLAPAAKPILVPQGLGAASNDNAPVPVAPAPVSTPVLGYAGGVGPAAQPPQGLGAIAAAAPVSGAPLGSGFGFDRSVNRTLGFEGGLNASDTNGTPSNFGINQQAHPEVDVTKLTPDQAKGIYKTDYWDAIGADKLPAPLAHVAFDTAVIAGPARAQQMIAQSGGDPTKFMDLRDGYLNGLLQSDPGKYGKYAGAWGARSAALRSDIGASGGVPSSTLSYAGGLGGAGNVGGGGGLGSAALPAVGLGAAEAPPSRGVAGFLGFGQGGNGGLLGLSDDARMGLLGAAAGMMSSPSKSVGVALGQGLQAGLQTYAGQQKLANERNRTANETANVRSEIATRQGELGLGNRKVDVLSSQFQQTLENLRKELALKSQDTANNTLRTKSEVGLQSAETYAKTHSMSPQGMIVSDPTNPSTPPKIVPYSTLTPSAGGPPAPAGSTGAAPASASAVDSSGFVHPPAQVPINPMLFSPEGRAASAETAKPTMDGARTAYEASQSTKMTLDQMQHEYANIPQTGFLASGPGQQQRAHAVNSLNSVLKTFGVGDDNLMDPKAVGSTEDLKKLTVRMGQDLAKSLGGREPGFIVQQSVGAVPSSENSPMGFQRIVGGLRAAAQRNEDRYNFLTEWQQKTGGDLTGADDAFNKANPPSRYVGQAILSTVPPSAVNFLRQHPDARGQFDSKFGAGTSNYVLGAS